MKLIYESLAIFTLLSLILLVGFGGSIINDKDFSLSITGQAADCIPKWECGDWMPACDEVISSKSVIDLGIEGISNKMYRECNDVNECGTESGMPATSANCVREYCRWKCTEWSECKNGEQARACTNTKGCKDTLTKPSEKRICLEEKMITATGTFGGGIGNAVVTGEGRISFPSTGGSANGISSASTTYTHTDSEGGSTYIFSSSSARLTGEFDGGEGGKISGTLQGTVNSHMTYKGPQYSDERDFSEPIYGSFSGTVSLNQGKLTGNWEQAFYKNTKVKGTFTLNFPPVISANEKEILAQVAADKKAEEEAEKQRQEKKSKAEAAEKEAEKVREKLGRKEVKKEESEKTLADFNSAKEAMIKAYEELAGVSREGYVENSPEFQKAYHDYEAAKEEYNSLKETVSKEERAKEKFSDTHQSKGLEGLNEDQKKAVEKINNKQPVNQNEFIDFIKAVEERNPEVGWQQIVTMLHQEYYPEDAKLKIAGVNLFRDGEENKNFRDVDTIISVRTPRSIVLEDGTAFNIVHTFAGIRAGLNRGAVKDWFMTQANTGVGDSVQVWGDRIGGAWDVTTSGFGLFNQKKYDDGKKQWKDAPNNKTPDQVLGNEAGKWLQNYLKKHPNAKLSDAYMAYFKEQKLIK